MDNTKKIIKSVRSGRNLEATLPACLDAMESCYCKRALLKGAMQYYMLYEMIEEKGWGWLGQAEEVLEAAHRAVDGLFSKEGRKPGEEVFLALSEGRKEVIRRMEALSAYTGIFQLYESVLKRLKYKYELEGYALPDEKAFVNKLCNYIYEEKGNGAANGKLMEAVGELPVRMAKKKYFQILEESFLAYEGWDKPSVDSYECTIRTNAMLYRPEGMEQYFQELEELRLDLEQRDFAAMEEEEYTRLAGHLQDGADWAWDAADAYIMAQEVLNALSIVALSSFGQAGSAEPAEDWALACQEIFMAICRLCQEKSGEGIPESLEGRLASLEGEQEELLEEAFQLEGALDSCLWEWKQQAESLGIGSQLERVSKMRRLSSASLFMDVEEETGELADKEYLKQKAEGLAAELGSFFKEHKMVVNRAVMAATLKEFPALFRLPEDGRSYIENALAQCHDREEKMSVMENLETMMSERSY